MDLSRDWIERLSKPRVQDFIRENLEQDAFALGLKHKEYEGIPFSLVAAQIQSYQKAKKKLPEWYHTEGIVFPPPKNLEQASSERTARYKASLIHGDHLTDLTGGAGVDTYYLADNFKSVVYVEQTEMLCELAAHNFGILRREINVRLKEATLYLEENGVSSGTFIYIDPSRRDQDARKVFRIGDCRPNLIEMKSLLHNIPFLIKYSPMLDLSQALEVLGSNVSEVHVLAVENEVKELLFLTGPQTISDPLIHAVDLGKRGDDIFTFRKSEETNAVDQTGLCGRYLYESNAAIRKAGAFRLPCSHYSVEKIAVNTHLYTSNDLVENFPGRKFEVREILPYHPGKIGKRFKKANIAVRNFPEDVATVRKRSGIRDGGTDYLFMFTDHNARLCVAVCTAVRRLGT